MIKQTIINGLLKERSLLQKEGYLFPMIALTGYSQQGKSEVAKLLGKVGYNKVAFSFIGKSELDSIIKQYYGFSAFTEDLKEKTLIRPILEQWMKCRQDELNTKYFNSLHLPVVNERLFYLQEALNWKACGGEIWEIRRDNQSSSELEKEALQQLHNHGLITKIIYNRKDLIVLQQEILTLTNLTMVYESVSS